MVRIATILICLWASAAAAEGLEGAAKAAIMGRLKDPESARFSDIVVKGHLVCGQVNAKNSMGGYVGKRFFLYDAGAKAAMLVDRNQEISTNIVDSIVRPREDSCK